MHFRLDVFPENEPRQKLEGQPSLSSLDEIQVYSINYLFRWDKDVWPPYQDPLLRRTISMLTDDAEILREPMTDEYTTPVYQSAKFLVYNFQGGESVRRRAWIKVTVWTRGT